MQGFYYGLVVACVLVVLIYGWATVYGVWEHIRFGRPRRGIVGPLLVCVLVVAGAALGGWLMFAYAQSL